MRSQTIFWVFACVPAVFAQTYTSCDPTKKSCPEDPALGTTYSWDFSQGASNKFTATGSKDKIQYGSSGMVMPVQASGDSPTITSNFYIFWGKVEINMKCAPGQGIVSSLVFQSDDLDEIDYEWIGSETTQVQTNYFGKGDTSVYDRGGKTQVSDPSGTFHTYGIEWTADGIKWSIDGNVIRTLLPNQVTPTALHSDLYPQTPMQIKIGSWSGGDPANSKGTIEWAGGVTDYSKGPYEMIVKSIKIQDYSVGATSYKYGDQSGSWKSIVINKDGSSSSGSNDEPEASSSSAAPASSSTPAKSSTPAVSSSAPQSTKPATTEKPASTLATSTRASASAIPDSTSSHKPTKTYMPGLIMSGLPNSVGTYSPGQDKGVNGTVVATTTSKPSTSTASKTSTATGLAASVTASRTPSATPTAAGNIGSAMHASVGSVLLVAFAGAVALL